tara:strand:- start:1097 stop:1420 length:324 start_codon:yes stop_codon:yes gene_type:complete
MGLYSNIHAKKKRIEAGSGETMRKKGDKGAPTLKNFKDAAKTRKMKGRGGPADLNNDGKLSSYEKTRGDAIDKAMAKQNRVKLKNGGFIAKGCGAVSEGKRKVTTIS